MTLTPAFLFDLDGTLVDTAPDLHGALNRLLASAGCAEIEIGTLRKLVGRGARNLIAQAFKVSGAPIAEDEVEPLYLQFAADYKAHVADSSQPYPGVVETLTALQAEGFRMGVVTNKPHAPSLALLDALDLSRFFQVVYGQGRLAWMKPDPRLMAEVMADIGGGPAVFVGDSVTDVEAARAGGLPVVLVSYGYTVEPARALGADRVVDDFCEIAAAGRALLGI